MRIIMTVIVMAMIATTDEETMSKYIPATLSQSAVSTSNFRRCRYFRQRVIEK
jgi:hypothetical protein